MGGKAGPTVSVIESGMNITGTAEDLLSGTVGYCYNQSDTPDDFTPVDPVQTTSYTAPQFHINASGVWRFHAKDLAGNTNFKSTSTLTKLLYHCNYCGQDTNSLTSHYRCSVHFTSQNCSESANCTNVLNGTDCNAAPAYTRELYSSGTNYNSTWYCEVCRNKIYSGNTYYMYYVGCSSHTKGPWENGGCAIVCSNCNRTGLKVSYNWYNGATNPPNCQHVEQCGRKFTTNYINN